MINNKFPSKDVTKEDIATKFPLAAKKNESHSSIVEVSGVPFGSDLIPVFAGPNTVESKELIVETALSVANSGAHFLRGGAFKPLTFPYRSDKYKEPREIGVEWLGVAKKEAGLPVITEIMEERHLKCMEDIVDILQIGTRNMQNFPLLKECARTGKAIMLKRGFGASLRDWLGAAEYILYEGNPNIILCERGVVAPHTHRETSRYLLDLQVIPAAKEITHLPVVADPSHATFWKPWVAPMAMASIAAGADGVMIEVHPDPSNSAVDPLQPMDFDEFKNLMPRMHSTAVACWDRHVLN